MFNDMEDSDISLKNLILFAKEIYSRSINREQNLNDYIKKLRSELNSFRAHSSLSNSTNLESDAKVTYLKQAFNGFFKSKTAVEMEHMTRVMCTILGLTVEEQEAALVSVQKLSTALPSSTFESISSSFTSLFSS